MTIKGSCLCGEVKYEIEGSLHNVSHCYCSMCCKSHGAAFATYAAMEPDKFKWVSGEELVTVYISSPEMGRCFCSKCGATLGAVEDNKVTYITLGTVDGDPGVRSEANIFVASKASWYEITDSLPQHDEYPVPEA
jgi:hypothetical protein